MQIFYQSDYHQLSQAAADFIFEIISKHSKTHLGLATGNSPQMTYALLGDLLSQSPSITSMISGFQIDEWIGLAEEHPSSCHFYIQKHIIEPWRLDPSQCFLLDGQAKDQTQQVEDVKKYLANNPLDICLLGLGRNGHLALNEPGSHPNDVTRIVQLDPSSASHNMLKQAKQPITRGITIGLKEIMESRKIVLLMTGSDKEDAYKNWVSRKPVESFPASILYEHPDCTCFIDEYSLKRI